MGRFITSLMAVATASAAFGSVAWAQSPVPSRPGVVDSSTTQPSPALPQTKRDDWRDLSPEERQRLKSNASRWLNLPPEERRALRARESARRERMHREAEAALRETGLQLDVEQSRQFERRYLQERRRIDHALRQEFQERRKKELAPVLEQLKQEFGPASRATASSPAPPK